jgi:tetratricopeptide (TPR) repeat protein
MIAWRAAPAEAVAPPQQARALLERASAAAPGNPLLHLKLADLHLDRFDFATALGQLEAARRLSPADPAIALRLARCLNGLGRSAEALGALTSLPGSHHERALSLLGLGREAEAEAELRAVLAAEPGHRHACWRLSRLLRKAGRHADLLHASEQLAARGVRHSQLLSDWGVALALCGREEEARGILFDSDRVAELPLPVPEGFADIEAFNAAVADELLGNPSRLSEFPPEEANRGSSRVHALFAGRRPDLMRTLLAALQSVIDEWAPERRSAFDPWLEARPRSAHLRSWGLIQRGGDFEEWHIHRGGWLSGVYYVRVPAAVSAAGDGPGCIEYGPPRSLAEARPGLIPEWRHAPRAGTVLLAPSHYPHRTIPSRADEYRISFAFDVVPHGTP